MLYDSIKKGIFIARPNRFIAEVIIDGRLERAHVKNTGRCRELLLQGAVVYLQEHANSSRRTKWSLIGVEKGNELVNIDSQAPNKVFFEWISKGNLFDGIKTIKPEFAYGGSRLDFYVETDTDKILIEVKGVTLEEDNIALFPDAPTERGVRHILELCDSLEEGFKACIVFVIQMEGVKHFAPNSKMHMVFAEALKQARDKGVRLIALGCKVGRDSLEIADEVEVIL